MCSWFKDPKFNLNYPSGPTIDFSWTEFRRCGADTIRKHFDEYSRIRLEEADAVPIAFDGGEKVALKQMTPVNITINWSTKNLTVTPLRFRKFDLGGIVSFGPEFSRMLAPGFSDEQFWDAFDAVLSDAR